MSRLVVKKSDGGERHDVLNGKNSQLHKRREAQETTHREGRTEMMKLRMNVTMTSMTCDDGGSGRLTKTSFHSLKLDSSTTGTRHGTSSMLKLLQSQLSQIPDIVLLTSSLKRELSRSHMGSNTRASLRFPMQHILLYTSRRNKRDHPVIRSN